MSEPIKSDNDKQKKNDNDVNPDDLFKNEFNDLEDDFN